MKFVLFVILYAVGYPEEPPQILHIAFNSKAQCEQAKKVALDRTLPKEVGGGAICISEEELLRVKD